MTLHQLKVRRCLNTAFPQGMFLHNIINAERTKTTLMLIQTTHVLISLHEPTHSRMLNKACVVELMDIVEYVDEKKMCISDCMDVHTYLNLYCSHSGTRAFLPCCASYNRENVRSTLIFVLLNPDIPFLCKQCRSRSVGF